MADDPKESAGISDLGDISLTALANNEILKYNSGTLKWENQTDVSGATTASNVGVGGVGLYKQKTGNDLEFRNVNAASNKVTVALDAGNNEVDVDVAEGNLTIANMSDAASYATLTGAETLTNKTATSNTNDIISRGLWNGSGAGSVSTYASAAPSAGQVIKATSATVATWQDDQGEDNTVSNIGAGAGIFKQKTGVDFELYSMVAGSNKATVVLDGPNNVIEVDVAEGNLTIANMSDAASYATLAGAESLSNKTLAGNTTVYKDATDANVISMPATTGADTFVLNDDAATIQNKTIQANNNIRDTTNSYTLTRPNLTSYGANDSLVTLNSTGTFQNKTIDRDGNTLRDIYDVQGVTTVSVTDLDIATQIIVGATIGGLVVSLNNKVLLVGQSVGTENGVYTVVNSGAAPRNAVLPVGAHANTQFMSVIAGEYDETIWMCRNAKNADVVGTHSLEYSEIDKGRLYTGEIWSETETTITGSGAGKIEVTNATTLGAYNVGTWDSPAAGRLRYTGARAETMRCGATISFKTTGGNNQEIEAEIRLNGVKISGSKILSTGDNNEYHSSAFNTICPMSQNDYFSIYVENNTGVNEVVINSFNIYAVTMH